MIEKLKFDRVEKSSLSYAAFIDEVGKIWFLGDISQTPNARVAVLVDGKPADEVQVAATHDLIQSAFEMNRNVAIEFGPGVLPDPSMALQLQRRESK